MFDEEKSQPSSVVGEKINEIAQTVQLEVEDVKDVVARYK